MSNQGRPSSARGRNRTINPSGLSYYLPDAKKKRTVVRIPQSHTLYVGPSACTRRHAIYAHQHGNPDDASFLFITQADVISGDYEGLVGDAVEDVLAVLDPTPRILIIAVFCIDDFLGTDEQAMLRGLNERFPGIVFAVDHIDPITLGEGGQRGPMKRHLDQYSFLQRADEHDQGVTMLGTFVPLDPESELGGLLAQWGLGPVRELFSCKTFDEYQALAKSRLCIGQRIVSPKTRHRFSEDLRIPLVYFPVSYDIDFVREGYEAIALASGHDAPDFSEEIERTREAVAVAVKTLDGRSIALDSSATLMPFGTARALLDYGFNVTHIFRRGHLLDAEEQALQGIARDYPNVKVTWRDDYVQIPEGENGSGTIAIGNDTRQLLGTPTFVDMWHDEGFFGFEGIRRLMAALVDAAQGASGGFDGLHRGVPVQQPAGKRKKK